jgi:hypothetical protein
MNDYEHQLVTRSNLKLCAKAAHEYRTNPKARDGIQFECYNKEDANLIRASMALLYPDIPIYFTWMKFY